MQESQVKVRPTRVERRSEHPLSYSQLFIWNHPLWAPGAPRHFWHVPLQARIRGRFDIETFEEALSRLVMRHEALRTTFHVSPRGDPVQRIASQGVTSLRVADLRSLAEERRAHDTEELLRRTFCAPFDLGASPPFRLLLLSLADDEQLLLAVGHHLIVDGRSQALLLREVAADYGALCMGSSCQVPEPPLQYVDYAEWQRQSTADGSFDAMIDYWVDQLSPPCSGLGLPTRPLETGEQELVHARPFAGATWQFPISRELTARATALARQLGVTPFSVFLSGFYLLMHARTGRSDLLASVPVMNRPRSCMNVFGCFAKQVPYRVRFADEPSFAVLVRRVHDVNRGAHANEAAPVVKAVERLGLQHAPQAAIGKAVFVFQNTMVPRVEAGNVSFELEHRWDLLDFAREDMVWQITAAADGFDGWLEYRTGLYTESFVQELAADYLQILGRAIMDPAVCVSRFRSLNVDASTPATE